MKSEGLIDRLVRYISPQWALRRLRSRMAVDIFARHYEAASQGRRTQGWARSAADANVDTAGAISSLRQHARDLVRNNPHAVSAANTIADHGVGWGIVAKPKPDNKRAADAWFEWADATACDADGRNNFYGLEKLVLKTVAVSGEALIRRRIRRPEDNLPLPFQLQILEPDYLDTFKTGFKLPNGGRIINGVEYDVLGKRAAYWLFPEHPGSEIFSSASSQRVPAEFVLHVFRQERPGQVRGVSWFAPVILTLKQFDEYTDAQLMKQLVAACLAVFITDPTGLGTPLGTATTQDSVDTPRPPELDNIGPGHVRRLSLGETVEVVQPPSVEGFGEYTQVTLRAIATGIGIPYEDLTGDYAQMPFSAARMSRLRHWARVEDWRWQMMIPQFCQPVWDWAMQSAMIMGKVSTMPRADWTAPPLPMIDPGAEGLAYMRNIRSGIMSLSEALRERGYDPQYVLDELATDFKKLDKLGLILDSDPRNVTQGGQLQGAAAEKFKPEPAPMAIPANKPNGKPVPAQSEE